MLNPRDLERFDAHEDKRVKKLEEALKSVERALVAINNGLKDIEKSIKTLNGQQYYIGLDEYND